MKREEEDAEIEDEEIEEEKDEKNKVKKCDIALITIDICDTNILQLVSWNESDFGRNSTWNIT